MNLKNAPQNEVVAPNFTEKKDLPVILADDVYFSTRSDNLCFIRLTTQLPEGRAEQARIMMGIGQLKAALDVICNHINYFPEKASTKKTAPTKKKTSTRKTAPVRKVRLK